MGRPKQPWALVKCKSNWKDSRGKEHTTSTWKVRYYAGKKKKTLTTGQTNERKAILIAQKWADDGKFNGSPEFADYSKPYFTEDCPYCLGQSATGKPLQKTWRIQLRSSLTGTLVKDLGNYTLRELTSELLQSYFMRKSAGGKAASTIENYKKALRPILDQAVRDKILKVNPLDDVATYTKNMAVESPKYCPTDKEVRALFLSEGWRHEQDDVYFRIAFVGLATGCRLGELQALQRKHISYDQPSSVMRIKVGQSMKELTRELGLTKTKRVRWVPAVGIVAHAVLAGITEKNDPEEYLFKREGQSEPIRQRVVNLNLKKAWVLKTQTEVPNMFSFHSLRHWYNTRLLTLSGHNVYLVRSIMGHSNSKDMTQNYKIGTPEEFEEALPYIWKLLEFSESETVTKYKSIPERIPLPN